MKKYRALVPIVMIVLMVTSWYVLARDKQTVQTKYTNYLSAARKYAEDGITKYAIREYLLALEIKSTPEIYMEIAEYYLSQEDADAYFEWCEKFLEDYPKQKEPYEYLLKFYLGEEDYKSCYDMIEAAGKRKIISEEIQKISEDLKYVYKITHNSYDDVRIYSNHYCAVANGGSWGFVDCFGNQIIDCQYLSVGALTSSNVISVVTPKKEVYFVDEVGDKVMVSKEKYSSFGLLSDGMIAAKKPDKKYNYVNSDFEVLFGDFDYASTMNGGIAVVKQGASWKVIGQDGKTVDDESYVDIILDENQVAFRNERLFAATEDGKYMMLNGAGEQIGTLIFEDAKVFAGSGPAAVKIDGKWCFVNSDGERISDKTYDDARSFSNSLAAVCIDGKWGFIDVDENIAIEPKFSGAKDFTEKGSCFVQTGEKWQLIKIYRLNR